MSKVGLIRKSGLEGDTAQGAGAGRDRGGRPANPSLPQVGAGDAAVGEGKGPAEGDSVDAGLHRDPAQANRVATRVVELVFNPGEPGRSPRVADRRGRLPDHREQIGYGLQLRR